MPSRLRGIGAAVLHGEAVLQPSNASVAEKMAISTKGVLFMADLENDKTAPLGCSTAVAMTTSVARVAVWAATTTAAAAEAVAAGDR